MFFDEAELYRAFDEDEFVPFFQPMVELRTGQMAGFELLARWIHRQSETILPDVFIPAVEKSGLINRLTRRILEKSFAVMPRFPASAFLSVNLSPSQLVDPALPGMIQAVASASGFALNRLTCEITESALVDDLPRAQAVARDLKSLGCRMALDDFGTGYSSLRHLQALPFDVLKVDKSFVGTMTGARESRKIVAAVVGLGHSLGLSTVAEGVETEAQADMLLWLGCDLGQGWLYGRPAPAAEISAMVARSPHTHRSALPAPADANSIMSLEALPAQRLAQLHAIYDGAPVGLCFLDRNMRYVSLNRRLAEMNGRPISAHIGRSPAEVIPEVLDQIEPHIRLALTGVPVSGIEIHRQRADCPGGISTVLATYQPVRDEAGEVLGVSVAIVDITARKLAEQALRDREEHHRRMVELNPHTPWVLDAGGKVIEASPRWERITGMSVELALGDGWLKALHPDDVEPTTQSIHETLRTGQSIDIEFRVQRREGGWLWMRSRGSPTFGPGGEVHRIYGSVEQIEHPWEIEEALERFRSSLQRS
jgi:PAS domain S-box-containing protein